MASMKPLFTITVLLIVGVYLYKTINEGPAPRPAGAQGVGDPSAAGIPPLAATGGGATLAQDSAAPTWPGIAANAGPAAPVLPPGVAPTANASAAAPTQPVGSTASADAAKSAPPDVPPIPELPELPTVSNETAASPPSTIPSVTGSATAAPAAAATPTSPAAIPASPAALPEQAPPAANAAITPLTNPPVAAPVPGAITPLPVEPAQAGTAPAPIAPQDATPPATAQSIAPADAPPNGPASAPSNDRYGLSTAAPAAPPAPTTIPAPITPAEPAPATPAATTFAASWPAIQAALDKSDLKQAHQLLSKWHGDETLSPTDAQKVETLLGQLAGTVIYSNEHRLEPPRIVKPGETLESIAKEYNVPWQLLAKINGVPAPDQVRPGQELKVVRGPFSAVVDLHRNEMTLEVDGRYAGTFNVTVPPGTTVTEGQWTVDQKVAGQPSAVAPASYTSPPAAADRTIVLRAAAVAQPGTPTLAITSGGPATPPSPGAVAIQVAPQDAEDLSDILSIGSRVIVRK